MIYVRKCYKSVQKSHLRQTILECMNSWGFEDPIPHINIASPAISKILQVDVIDLKPVGYRTKNHGFGCTCFPSMRYEIKTSYILFKFFVIFEILGNK